MPSLQLDAYFIDEILIKANPDYDPVGEEIGGEITVTPQHLTRKDDESYHQLVLAITYLPREGAEANIPYRVEITGRGYFHFDDPDVAEDDRRRTLMLNGSSILFGLLRAEVAHTTALGRYGAILLPPVDLIEAFRRRGQQLEAPGLDGVRGE